MFLLNLSIKAVKPPSIYYLLFVVVYALLLVVYPVPSESGYDSLRETVLAGEERFPSGFYPSIGRFYPLAGVDYNLILKISDSFFALTLFNGIQFIVLAWMLPRLLLVAGASLPIAYLLSAIIFLSPGFSNVWVGFAAPERNGIFYFSAFLFAYQYYQKNPSVLPLATSLLFANGALYFKEPGFLMLSGFVVGHLVGGWGKSNRETKIFDWLLIGSSLAFVGAYFIVFFGNVGDHLYGEVQGDLFAIFIRNIGNYVLNDPIIMVLGIPLSVYRFLKIIHQQEAYNPTYDSMLLGGMLYITAFFYLNIFASNYLLPAYAFFLPAIVYFLVVPNLRKTMWIKALMGIVGFLIVSQSLLYGMHVFSFQKVTPVNWVATMDVLAREISQPIKQFRPSVFIAGVQPDLTSHPAEFTYDRDVYFNVGQALQKRGLSPQQFDLKSTLIPKSMYGSDKFLPKKYHFSVFQFEKAWEPQAGDYLLITPASPDAITDRHLEQLSREYSLLFRTQRGVWDIPNVSLKTWIKMGLMQTGLGGQLVGHKNLYQWPEFLIFMKK
jgi:hypothetical protein